MQAPLSFLFFFFLSFFFCSLKSHQGTQGWSLRQHGQFVFQGLNAPISTKTCRSNWTDKKKKVQYNTDANDRSSKTQTVKFAGKGDECRYEDQGRGKGRRDRKD